MYQARSKIVSLLIASFCTLFFINAAFAVVEDLAVKSISLPASTFPAQRDSEVRVVIENKGPHYLGGIVVRYRVNSGSWKLQTYLPGFFLSGATLEVPFSSASLGLLSDFSVPGTYTIEAQVHLPSDANPSDNSLTVDVEALPPTYPSATISEFPYIEDFESGAGGWAGFSPLGAPSGVWELGTPVAPAVGGIIDSPAPGGTNSWVTKLSSFHPSNAQNELVSPLFDLSDFPLVNVSLSVWWESTPGNAGAKLQKTTDEGVTWTTVGAAGDPENWYTDSNVQGLDYTGDRSGWSGYETAGSAAPYMGAGTYASSGSEDWVTAKNTISGGEATRLRIAFGALRGTSDDGFGFDNISISPAVSLTQSVALIVDNETAGFADIGDTVRFTALFNSESLNGVSHIEIADSGFGSGLQLVVGSVTASQGSVTLGNTSGDTELLVDVGTVAPSGTFTVTYDAIVTSKMSDDGIRCGQSSVSAFEFNGAILKSDDVALTGNADSTCFMVALSDFDMDGIPDSVDDDDDNDGVSDSDEIAAGTNPRDAGSNVQVLSTNFCSEWNGFLGLLNVNEYSSAVNADRSFVVTLFDDAGVAQSATGGTVKTLSQSDILVHALGGFEADSYGRTCTSVNASAPGDIYGRTILYHPNSDNSGIDFALSIPFANSLTSKQYVQFNTFSPNLGEGEFVANWISVSNPASMPLAGSVNYYAQDGSLLGSEAVVIPAEGRSDFAAHQFGQNLVGLVEWAPTDVARAAAVRNVRFFFDNSEGAPSFSSAMPVHAQKGIGEEVVLSLDKTQGSAVVELSNTTDMPIVVNAVFRSLDGTEQLTQSLGLAARQTGHLVVDSIISTDIGSVALKSNVSGSLLALATHYERDADLTVLNAYSTRAKEAKGDVLRGSYNTFLEQGCDLIVVNSTASEVSLRVSMVRFDGTEVLTDAEVIVPAKGTSNYALCANDEPGNYGSVEVRPSTRNTVSGVIVRNGKDNRYRFVTNLEAVVSAP